MDKSVVRGLVFAPGAGKKRSVNRSEYPYEADFRAAEADAVPFVSPNTDDWNPKGSRRLTHHDLDKLFLMSETRRAAQIARLEESRLRVHKMRVEERQAAAAAANKPRTILLSGQFEDLFSAV